MSATDRLVQAFADLESQHPGCGQDILDALVDALVVLPGSEREPSSKTI